MEDDRGVIVDTDPLSTLFDAVDAVATRTNVLVEEGHQKLKGGKKTKADKAKKAIRLTEKHKFNNIDAKAFNAVVHHQKGICFAYSSD